MTPPPLTLTPTSHEDRIAFDITADALSAQPVTVALASSTSIARIYDARLIRASQPNGWTVPADVLQRSVALWDGAGVYVDHPGLFDAPSIRNLIGVVRNTHFSEPDALSAEIHLFAISQAEPIIELLDLLISQRAAVLPTPPTGLSAVLSLKWEYDEATDARRVTEITKVWSVDVVHEPAADGHVTRILNSQQHSQQHSTGELSTMDPQNETQLNTPTTAPPATSANPPNAAEPAVTTQLSNAILAAQCEQLLSLRLSSAGLPDAVAATIRQRFQNNAGNVRIFDPSELDHEIASARAIAAALAGDAVTGMGTPAHPQRQRSVVGGMWTDMDRLQAAYDLMMGVQPDSAELRDVPRLTGIRELYHLITGDRDMHGRFEPTRVMFANATSTTLAELTRNVINKIVNQTWSNLTDYRWWERVVRQYNFSSLKDASWVVVGGIGDLSTVTEGASYPEVTWDDKRETSTWLKKGGYLGLTLEMIDKDDTEKWRVVPEAMSIAALRTLSASVGNIFTQASGVGPTLADGLALFHTTHANLTTTALSAAQWDVVVRAVYSQSELNSSRRLAMRPSLLIVPIELRKTAIAIFASAQEPGGNNNDINVAGWSENFNTNNVIVCPEFTDANDWAAMVDPRIAPAIGVGFRFGNRPEVFIATDPTSYLMFHNDVMPIKVRFFYNVGVIDYRPVHKANVA